MGFNAGFKGLKETQVTQQIFWSIKDFDLDLGDVF